MVFKLRMLSDEADDFVREYEVPSGTDLLQLHDFICNDLGYDTADFSSFFSANSKWNKLQEYTLADMQDDECGIEAKPMAGSLLSEIVAGGVSRLIFVFDLFAARSLFLEVTDFKPEEDAVEYPRVSLSAGVAPAQANAGSIASQEDPFGEMMEEFSGFEGAEDDSFGDDF